MRFAMVDSLLFRERNGRSSAVRCPWFPLVLIRVHSWLN